MNPIFQTFAPPKALQPYVKQYLYAVKDFEVENTFPIIPTGFPALLLFLEPKKGGIAKYYQPFQKTIKLNEFYLYGLTTESFWVDVSGEFKLFIIVLNPTTLNNLLQQSAAVITNTIIPFSNIGLDSTQVVEQLLDSQNLLQQLPVLDAFLLKLFSRPTNRTDEVDSTLHHILNSSGLISLYDIQKRERVSTRTLERKFNERIGVTPKAYLRLIRFRSMMQFISTHPQFSWLDLIYQFGYYDQSHLIKDFKKYTGHSPQIFLRTEQDVEKDLLKFF